MPTIATRRAREVQKGMFRLILHALCTQAVSFEVHALHGG